MIRLPSSTMAKTLASALDAALDDLVTQSKKAGKGKKKGKGQGKGKGVIKSIEKPKVAESKKMPKEKAPAKSTLGAAKQLDMSLDDIVKTGFKTGKKNVEGKGAGKSKVGAKAQGKGVRKLWGGAAKVLVTRKVYSGKGGKGKAKGKSRDSWGDSWGKGKSDRKGKGKGKNWQSSWSSGKKGYGKGGGWGWKEDKSWGGWGSDKRDNWDSWDRKGRKGSGKKGKNDWDASYEKRRPAEDSWGKRRPADDWEPEYSSRKGSAQSYEKSYEKKPRNDRVERVERPERGERKSPQRPRDLGRDSGRNFREVRETVSGRGQKRGYDDMDEPVPGRAKMVANVSSKKIKVANIPRDLGMRDIREAFEAEAGRVEHCEMRGDTAYIEFGNAKDARKAVDTFDRGELNGRTIEVTFDRS